ncbi:alkaline phosphatase family protein [Desulfosporosinus nitroreducens]|uniref:alkaline phosphatase family protein n=1 Tax=Desulfosporosinus nitroreducens TaxID=2018668 RepID=UPI00207C4C81|nr:alkaline phosphatase family protein [Desulfosporosinus nitroreducens]MCO1602881.1 alkaline phosphatase family protein [Desulfosporosinus nitroreducens]
MKREALTQKLLVLGVDGMDPKVTRKFLAEGIMPNLQKFIEKGSAREDLSHLGALPTITPACWTTLATGAYPGTHGITCFWRQSPKSLDAVVYNMDSRNCEAEQLWNVTTEAGLKTLVWHWPGSAWPPTSDNPNLNVVDGTQPGSVNMGVAQLDWEKVIAANEEITELIYAPKLERPAGTGCMISDLSAITEEEEEPATDMMELWYGEAAMTGSEIREYIMGPENMEMVIESIPHYDVVNSPLKNAEGWAAVPADAKEFTILTSDGIVRRPTLILKNSDGIYDRIAIYKNKKAEKPIVVLELGKMVSGIVDDINKEGVLKPACRSMKLLELSPDGTSVKLWISNALDIAQDKLWHPKELLKDVVENVGPVQPVSLVGGEDAYLVEKVYEPAWDSYCQWQAKALNHLIKKHEYQVVFSHLHNVDCAGHMFWHLAKNLERWSYTDPEVNQNFIRKFYIQTDKYLGEFLHLLDEGWTIMILADHGLLVGEEFPPQIGEYGGMNVQVMEELGYTVMKKDANGKTLKEVDWEKTTAVQTRSNYIYINLKGRDAHGIVDPADKYELERKIMSDLYSYRYKGQRVIGLAMRNKDAVVLGTNGPQCGDIFFTVDEGFSRLHGDGLSTVEGAFDTSVSPIFLAAGTGIKENFTTARTIRQVDIAPTIATLIGVRMPAHCEGGPIYQILTEEM